MGSHDWMAGLSCLAADLLAPQRLLFSEAVSVRDFVPHSW